MSIVFEKMVQTLKRIDRLINTKSTGNPKELAKKLKVSPSTTYAYLSFMKQSLNAPLAYSRLRRSYYYKTDGKIIIEFKRYDK